MKAVLMGFKRTAYVANLPWINALGSIRRPIKPSFFRRALNRFKVPNAMNRSINYQIGCIQIAILWSSHVSQSGYYMHLRRFRFANCRDTIEPAYQLNHCEIANNKLGRQTVLFLEFGFARCIRGHDSAVAIISGKGTTCGVVLRAVEPEMARKQLTKMETN